MTTPTIDSGSTTPTTDSPTSEPGTSETVTIETVRFGTVSLPEDRIIEFPRGLLGFPDARRFGFIHPEEAPGLLFWMQSCDHPELAFVVCDPRPHFPDYEIPLSREDQEFLEIATPEEGMACVILVVPGDPREITANLRGPVILNPETRRALQLALPGTFPVKAPLLPQSPQGGEETPCSS